LRTASYINMDHQLTSSLGRSDTPQLEEGSDSALTTMR